MNFLNAELNARDNRIKFLEGENLQLRIMCALAHAGIHLYSDDGELQDSRTHPFIDWKRDSVEEIQEKLLQRTIAALKKEGVVL